jgi:hypothetical protein
VLLFKGHLRNPVGKQRGPRGLYSQAGAARPKISGGECLAK